MLVIVQYLSIISCPGGGLLFSLAHLRHNLSWLNEMYLLYSIFKMPPTAVKLMVWLSQINKPCEAADPRAHTVLYTYPQPSKSSNTEAARRQ